MEAKRLLLDEIERKRVSFLLNEDKYGRHYPTRAEMPKLFSIVEESKKLLQDLPIENEPRPRMIKKVGIRPMDKKMLEKRELEKQKKLEAKSKLENEQKIREAAKEAHKKNTEFDDLFNL